jgi:hypothetical protein
MKIRAAGILGLVLGVAALGRAQGAAQPDAKLHADTVKLIELTGMRKRLLDGRDKSIADGRKAMMANCPMCTPQYFDEWTARMTSRYRVEDYLAVYVDTYQKYFTDSEILELTAMQGNGGVAPSPALKAKVSTVMSPVMTEIYAKVGQVRGKMSETVTDEIAKEHPGWIVRPPAPPSQ